VRITPAELFQERPITRIIKVVFEKDNKAEAKAKAKGGEVNIWGQAIVDETAPDQEESGASAWGTTQGTGTGTG
jgi:hypothetical protein